MALTDLEVVRERVLSLVAPLDEVALAVADALGTVTAAPVLASESVPPFDNSAMDGFAVRAVDVAGAPVQLRVIATIAAGDDPSATVVGEGEAARIMTGAPLPPGADAVVMIEETDGGSEDRVEIRRGVGPGDFVRKAGEDLQPGTTVVGAQELLVPARAALLAAAGCERVRVIPRPRVGVLSTGDELIPPGVPLRHGQIRDSNRVLLCGMAAGAGFEPVDLGVVSDDKAAIARALRDATDRCDAVLTTGGVSVGDFDFLAPVLAELGQAEVWRLAIKPAKPFVFGLIGRVPVFALPGNPVSCAVSFELLARPALRKMAGYHDDALVRQPVRAVAGASLGRKPDGKTHYVRVTTDWQRDGRIHVRSAGSQGSHVLSALAAAGGLAVLPDGIGVEAGGEVDVLLISAERG